MKKTIYIYFFLNFCFILFLLSHTSCRKQHNDTNQKGNVTSYKVQQADSLYRLGQTYSKDSLDQDRALTLYEKALQIFQQLNDKHKIAEIYKGIGLAYDYKENFQQEITFLKKAYPLFVESGDKLVAGRVLDDMGISYTILGEIDSSIACYNKGLEIAIEVGDSIEVIEFYQNMGISYTYKNDYEKAIECHLQTLKLSEKAGYVLGIFNACLNLSEDFNNKKQFDIAYSYLEKANNLIDKISDEYTKAGFYDTYAAYYYEQKDLKTAAIYYTKCLEVSQSVNFKRGMACAYSNLSLIAVEEQKFSKAEEYCKLSIQLEREINNTSGIILSHCEIAECQYKQNNFENAIAHLKEAEEMSIKTGMFENLSEVLFHFYKVYQKSGNPEKALQYSEKYHDLKDSLDNVEIQERIADLEIQYQTEKKLQEIELLNEENETKKQEIKARNRLIILLVLLLMLILGIAYFIRQHHLKKLYRIESELQQYILRLKDIDTKEQKNETDFTSKTFTQKYDLTEREIEVLTLISEGLSNLEIADKIFVSTNTIKFHIKNIYLKLDVKNRVEALNKLKKSA